MSPRAAAPGKPDATRLQKVTATLKGVVGKTVRLRLGSGRQVDGVVKSVGQANVTLETDQRLGHDSSGQSTNRC